MNTNKENFNFYENESSEISEKDTMKNTINLLCSSCSERVRHQFCKLNNIEDFSLISESDVLTECKKILPINPKLIFNILRNVRTHKNKYLIIGTALDFFMEARNQNRYGILSKLQFQDIKSILWGTKEEQINNFPLIHLCIIQDILNNEDFFIGKYNKTCKIEHSKSFDKFKKEKYEKEFNKYCEKNFIPNTKDKVKSQNLKPFKNIKKIGNISLIKNVRMNMK